MKTPSPPSWTGPVRVVRSRNRQRTVSARIVDGVLELRVPARLSAAEVDRWRERLGSRLARREQGRMRGDEELETRARQLNVAHFEGRLRWDSIRFSTNQQRRWGSCSTVDGRIRISDRVRAMPDFVLDYLLVHELAHLVHDHHGPEFWELVNRFGLTERARGYLMAIDDGQAVTPAPGPDHESGTADPGPAPPGPQPPRLRVLKGGFRVASGDQQKLPF